MKFFKFVFIVIFVLAILGYGVYYFGTNIASEKIMEVVSSELEKSGQMETLKETIENDPELKGFIEDAESVDEDTLPFTTKEEATRMLVKKVGISEIQDIQSKVESGQLNKEELLHEMQRKLTEDELTALKVIAYKELYN
ncbi:hypothetical protein SAMN05216389_101185 [Oceanobacillus limi]|uniref:Phenylalanyl-tRNA synthetase subunit beta n=1 Tax=Oceanobacillus limi TaxID=930131 RepID=A0A1H9Y5M8_9BACI|nr:hypothetical protein [Oceanobacillus limi]SES63708.1 hypothetical protein SAMN05216389_101185 [Oceanobacillus limi]